MSGQNRGVGSDLDVDMYNFLNKRTHNRRDRKEGFQSGSSVPRSDTLLVANGKGILTKGT